MVNYYKIHDVLLVLQININNILIKYVINFTSFTFAAIKYKSDKLTSDFLFSYVLHLSCLSVDLYEYFFFGFNPLQYYYQAYAVLPILI